MSAARRQREIDPLDLENPLRAGLDDPDLGVADRHAGHVDIRLARADKRPADRVADRLQFDGGLNLPIGFRQYHVRYLHADSRGRHGDAARGRVAAEQPAQAESHVDLIRAERHGHVATLDLEREPVEG